MLPFVAFGTRRKSGSMLIRFFRQAKFVRMAGLFREKAGIIEKPLLVIPTEPEKLVMLFVLSGVCAETSEIARKNERKRM